MRPPNLGPRAAVYTSWGAGRGAGQDFCSLSLSQSLREYAPRTRLNLRGHLPVSFDPQASLFSRRGPTGVWFQSGGSAPRPIGSAPYISRSPRMQKPHPWLVLNALGRNYPLSSIFPPIPFKFHTSEASVPPYKGPQHGKHSPANQDSYLSL